MDPSSKEQRLQTTRAVSPARLVSLALIALVAAVLAYVRFATGDETVSVPSGAKPGDLALKPCEYATESGTYKADCGTFVVPENRADAASRLIALPVKRIRAKSSNPAAPVFRLEGGPGVTNMEFRFASRFAGDRDVVLVGYRGVDGSVRLDCPEVESALAHSPDVLSDKSFRAYADGFRSCASRLTEEGVDLAGYGLVQQVDDLEAVRVALGYDRIDLVSESAGTRTAMIYAWRHPGSIHRSVMIAVNPPGHYMWDPKTTDEQIARYAAHCARDTSCSDRTDDLAGTVEKAVADMPDRWWFLPIKKGNVRVASMMGMMESTTEATPFAAPIILDSLISTAGGDDSGSWMASLASDLAFPKMFVWGQYAAAGKVDSQAAREYFASAGQDYGTNVGLAASAFVWAGGRLADAWPTPPDEGEYSRVRTSMVETLLIGGELDVSTPPQTATKELLPHLPNGKEVVLAGIGHSGSFWNYQSEAGTRLINTYLDTGGVDDSLYTPGKIDFTPSFTFTMLAKIVAGVMIGLALITVLSLLWMARRVHKRGRFGRKASAVLRSVYPVLLGLGGWFLGALIVLTAFPSVPLDHALLAVLSVGLPVSLCIYLAWMHTDMPATVRGVGLIAVTAGALIGAWLGFHATDGLLALFTAIAGAVAGANLTLILFDVSREQPTTQQAPGVAATPWSVRESGGRG